METQINFDQLETFTEKYDVDTEVVQRTKIVAQLVQLREYAGLTQSELGKEVGMTQAQLSKIEKGLQRPRLETIKKLANYFKQEITLTSK